MNNFFLQGLQHPFFTPAHLITLLALAMLLGIHKRTHAIFALPIFVIFALMGLLATRFYRPDLSFEVILLAVAALIGIIIAIKVTLPKMMLFILASIIGISIGLDSEVIIIPGLKASTTYFNMLGTLLSVSFTLLITTLISMTLNPLWNSIVLRILGSWASASSLMVLAFIFAPKA
ncbi:MAG: HupE / UreJ protein [uncultured Thiotrichaceae bacterium]|uniref:HupE / UreJ protein n=1 Tax=uncultured Thiotrichaceae bacterium TaxID=298394 RepID=A0A6S6TCL4_9GAMM|nr:MAG: HupE / UreJ protein [uncultured Thiotrichaceae bacterium]